MSEQQNLQIVQQNYADFGQNNLPAVISRLSENVQWETGYTPNVPYAGVWKGHEGVNKFFLTIYESVEVLDFQISEFYAQDNTVIVLGWERARARVTNQEFKNEWVHVWTIEDSKVLKVRTYNNTAAVAAAFGAS